MLVCEMVGVVLGGIGVMKELNKDLEESGIHIT